MLNRLKTLLVRWREKRLMEQEPPPPDLTWPTHVVDLAGTVADVVVGRDGWHRVVIIRGNDGVYRLQTQAWAPDWGMSNHAAWFGHGHDGSLCDTLARARVLAEEALGHGQAAEQADAADEVRDG